MKSTTFINVVNKRRFDEISKFNSNLSTPWIASIRRLLPVVNILHGKHQNYHVDQFVQLVEHLCKHKGKTKAMTILKQYRLALQQYCLNQKLTPIPFTKVDGEGFPKVLNFIKPNKLSEDSMRYSLSVFRLIEEFRCTPSLDVSTIMDESTADRDLINDIIKYIESRPKILEVLPEELGSPAIILSNKAGPNGPASISADKDLEALQQDSSGLIDILEDRLNRYGSDILPSDYLPISNVSSPKSYLTGKLVLLSDKACKTRVIAIADWWSNLALSNLHKAFMKGLSRLKSDATYHQDKLSDLVRGFGHALYSSDMTAFTDRFPRILEKKVIEAVYGTQEAEEWERIICDRKFYHNKLGFVTYTVGNPMGVLSSWAVSSFTHHVVKHYCAFTIGKKYQRYLILGDDTLDSDKEIYDKYISVIRGLGVSISLQKCTNSETGYAEFAKRLFTPNSEVTGLPIHLLEGLDSNPHQFMELLKVCRSRGYKDEILIPGFLALLKSGLIMNKDRELIACIFALPESVSGMKPLFTKDILLTLGFTLDARSLSGNILSVIQDVLPTMSEEQLIAALQTAKNATFWELVANLEQDGGQRSTAAVGISNTHPLWGTLYNKAEAFQPEEAWETTDSEGNLVYLDKPNEYYLYEQWMKGNYRELAVIPTINTYRYSTKGSFATKCKYDVLSKAISLIAGDCNINLYKCPKYSDKYLFKLALYRIIPDKGDLELKDMIASN